MKSLLRLFLMVTLLVNATFARASLLSTINYFSCAPNCAPLTVVNTISQNGSALSFSNSYGGAFSQAAYGTLKASVDSSFTASPNTFSSGSSLAQFSDWIMLGGLTGPQMVTFVLHTDGALGGTGESTNGTAASMSITLDVNGQQVAIVADYFGGLLASAPQGGLSGTFALDYGTQISLGALLQVSGSLGGFAHFGNTVSLEIFAPQGTSLISGSGTEYRLATIPEPGTCALLLLGLFSLLAARNRYRRC
ncbi:PEP-CTERM sorting domain-containing protein [Pseudoduganella eburnea]|uniref:PEP-CTERM sorting domain-containing protein n=1 Tax=Massilia eburnea TaxID=1776165 RepID=A0A6L6QHE5_9BURK|nr:PEP-CTERM sorting domain-containing protein [Massilia eburnea]MTW11317.1 PEP-CTERM sorting domain-containing protein [Massilia eburnea]